MQLGVHESRQTAVELLGVTDNARGSVRHSLQPVCNELRCPGENCIAVIYTGRHESVDECGSRLRACLGDLLGMNRRLFLEICLMIVFLGER